MPRRHLRPAPRWRRGHAVTVSPVQLSGRQARQFAFKLLHVTIGARPRLVDRGPLLV